LLLAQYFAGPDTWALGPSYKKSLKRQLQFIIAKRPQYTWGGAENLDQGLDCSGYIFLACKWAGIPGITRTTALHISLGLGGWQGKDIDLTDADECDLPFWTFYEDRQNGHVGALLLGPDGEMQVTHASSRRGVVLDNLDGVFVEKLTKLRRLTIGD
jgi:hypothetical protein